MISVRSLQYQFSRAAYQSLLRVNTTAPNTDTINLMWRDIMFRTETTPLSGKYRVEPYKPFDLAALNAELSLMQIDTDTISAFLEQYLLTLSDLEYVADVWKEYASRALADTTASLRSFYGNRFIDGVTMVLSPRKIIDAYKSTVTVNIDNTLTVSPNIATIPVIEIHDRDITVTPIGDSTTATLIGEPGYMFNSAKPSFVMTLNSRITGVFGFDIRVTTAFPSVNGLRIDFGSAQTGLAVTVITTLTGTATTAFDAVVNAQFVTVPIATAFTSVSIKLRRDEPSSHTLDGAKYEFVVKSLSFLQSQVITDAAFFTKRIELGSDVKSAYLVTSETAAGDGSVAYYAATSEENGYPASYRPITPNDSTSPITFGQETHAHTCRISNAMTKWPTCGDAVMNVRCLILSKYLQDYLISKVLTVNADGVIAAKSSEYEVLYDLVELHRGFQDYSYTCIPEVNTIDATKLAYRIHVNSTTNWIDLLPLQYIETLAITSDMIIKTTTTTTTVRIPYLVENAETLELKSSTGTVTKPKVMSISALSEACDIVLGTVLDLRKPYTLSIAVPFHAYLSRNSAACSLTAADIVITVGDVTLTPYTDFVFHEDILSVELLKQGKYGAMVATSIVGGSLPSATISYSFQNTTNLTRRVYETHVYVDKNTPITVLPFTPAETAAGNFHKCNGVTISFASSYTLTRGWNRIQTTQPYPNCAGKKEVNQCTGIFSGAGLIFSSEITNYRAYRNAMRKVPLFTLKLIPLDDVHKCFAVHDQQVMIAFQPDACDPTILTASSGSMPDGKRFTCRKPTIDTKFATTGYTAAPERFQMIIPVKKAASDNILYIKALLNQPDAASVVRIEKIGINTFKE